jgi:hypothetical protein
VPATKAGQEPTLPTDDETLLGAIELGVDERELDERELLGATELGATLEVAPSQAPLSVQCAHCPDEVVGLFAWVQ